MSAAIFQSPEDCINDALVRIGYKRRIGSIYEGTEAAKIALDIYSQTRDQMLRDGDYGFARGDIALALLKTAPAGGYVLNGWTSAYPPLPWKYEYTYPSDCLKVRNLRTTPIFIPDFDPQPSSFDTPNDNSYSPSVKVIVTNVQNAICTYTRQVTAITQWEPSAIEALCAEIGRRLAPALAGMDATKLEASDEQAESAQSAIVRG